MEKELVTYSRLNGFRNCRKLDWWKYEQCVHPIQKAWNLVFGKAVHKALETLYTTNNPEEVMNLLDSMYPQRGFDPAERTDYLLLVGMMNGYIERYLVEEFTPVCLETRFRIPIINPATGAKSRTFDLAGRADGVVQMIDTREFYLLENKSASEIGGNYIERLWTDFQIRLYRPAIEKQLGLKIAGVIYNILGKTRIRPAQGETDFEYQARVDASKTGKIKRKVAESDEEFLARLKEYYSRPEAFHREKIYFTEEDERLIQAEVWELTQNILEARRSGMWYQNSTYCFHWNRACPYYPLCRANGKHQILLENEYEIRPPHEELEDETN